MLLAGFVFYMMKGVYEEVSGHTASLVTLATFAKLISLCYILVVNGEISRKLNKEKPRLKKINKLILLIVIAIMIAVLLKIFGFSGENAANRSVFAYIYHSYIYKNLFIVSLVPVFLYAILDLSIAYTGFFLDEDVGKAMQEKAVARRFFWFADAPAMFPLFLVLFLPWMAGVEDSRENYELFYAGSASIVILISAISSAVVEKYE